MTDTFFDLQRFAVLVGGQSSFTWKDGELFAADSDKSSVGTSGNPAHLVTKGGVSKAGNGKEIYLDVDKSYPFSLTGKEDWEIKLGTDNVLQVTNDKGLALGTLKGEEAANITLKGAFAEAVNNIPVYINTAEESKIDVSLEGSSNVYTFKKTVADATVAVAQGDIVDFSKGVTKLTAGAGSAAADANDLEGAGFAKEIQLRNVDGELNISSGNNTVTLPNDEILEFKGNKALGDLPVTFTDGALTGITKATLKTADGFDETFKVNNTTWDEISGGMSSIVFDSVGAATVDNDGAVVAKGQTGAKVTVKNFDSATVNGIKVSATATTTDVAFTLETVDGDGLSAITLSKASDNNITVNKDKAFDVVLGKKDYDVTTSADSVTFNAKAAQIDVIDVAANKSYAVDGGNASFTFAENAKKATLNGAEVALDSSDGVVVTAKDADAGITSITGLKVGEKVNVANDNDGFTAVFNAVETDGEVVFEVNDASIKAAGINGQTVTIQANGSDVTVTGMSDTDKVSIDGSKGITYHFKDENTENAVAPPTVGDFMYVTLDSTGAVQDFMDDPNYKKLKENDQAKWDNVASVGSIVDTVPGHTSDVFGQFYNLNTSNAGQQTVATFATEDAADDEPSTVPNPTGVTFTARDTDSILAQNAHVTLSTGSSVGAVPINVQINESNPVVDAVIDLRNAVEPSTVAIGTLFDNILTDLDASHEIYLSNAGTGYVYLGSRATGQNKVTAGTAGAQIRNDGSRATITGNSGNDTIWAGSRDIVSGKSGKDQFYDTESYTITDYSAAEGDALIATRLHSVDEITKDNLNFNENVGNEIGFGTSNKKFTIGTDQNASLNLKVAVMDTDARIVGSRNVAVAGINGGELNANALDGAALIVADEKRNNNSGDAVFGTGYDDTIYIGANDTVNGMAGNDFINLGGISTGDAGAVVAVGEGKNTVAGWNFGFDRNDGNSELLADEGFFGSFENDRLLITTSNGSMLFDDTKKTSEHGEYKVLINGTKYMAIRTNDENNTNPASFGDVASNDELADVYIAERAGILSFGASVTASLGEIRLGTTQYQNISNLALNNNSKAVVFGTSERETVALSGEASVGANKAVSLGAGNDVIISSGNSTLTAGNSLFFGANDGRDTIRNFSHYLGVDVDPDKQYADTLVLENYGGIYTGTAEDGGTRIEFVMNGDSRVFLYEADGIDAENIYQIKIGDFDAKRAKIGNSDGANIFNYSDKVAYYVGSSAENAQDTLKVGAGTANANIWLDGTHGTNDTNADEEYYRGIAVVDASEEVNTFTSLVGAGNNNTLIAGGEGTANSLWGGSGDNVLIGSEAGIDTFFYVRSAGAYLQGVDDNVAGGNDQIYNFNLDNGDIVWLGDTTIDDITSTEVKDNSVTVNFNTGGSLTVNGTDDVRFVINGGTESWVTEKTSEAENKWVKE